MKSMRTCMKLALAGSLVMSLASPAVFADQGDNGNGNICRGLPDYNTLKSALLSAVSTEQSGLQNNMWAVIVARDGTVCEVARSGALGQQWPGSRAIAAQKANTANSYSLDKLALSTANLYETVQPGQSLFGLQFSNPVDTGVAYKGPYSAWGGPHDPMDGRRIGGVNVFGGGLALYKGGKVVGALGLSGDTSCADHMKAWRVRHTLGLDQFNGTVAGVSGDPTHPDNIIYDLTNPFGHPECLNTGDQTKLPAVQ